LRSLAFLGSKEIGTYCLDHLLRHGDTYEIDVVAVMSNGRQLGTEKTSVLSLAQSHNIPILSELDDLLELPSLDFIVSVQYHEILRHRHIEKAEKLAINLHMAPLPEYRGSNQFSFAILHNRKEFGTTLHQLEPGVDDGAIIAERRFNIPVEATAKTLYERTLHESKMLFDEQIGRILGGRFTLIPQHFLVEERGTEFHYRKEIEQIKQIDLSWPEEKIDRHIRATWFPPFEPPYAMRNGEKISLTPDWRNELK